MLLLLSIVAIVVVIIKSHSGHWSRNNSRLLSIHIIATISELRWWTTSRAPSHVVIAIAIQMIVVIIICSSRSTIVWLGQILWRRRWWRWQRHPR